jgi:hypothetical protein
MALIDLTSVGAAKDWIPGYNPTNNTDSAAPNDRLQALITAVSHDIVRRTGATVDLNSESPTYGMSSLNARLQLTEIYDGNGSNVLFPDASPIRSISKLQVGPYVYPLSTSFSQPGAYIERGGYSIALRQGYGSGQPITTVGYYGCGSYGSFPMGRGNVLLEYVAGWGIPIPDSDPLAFAAPNDLQVACWQIVALYYLRRDRIGLDAENIQGVGNTTYSKLEIPAEAASVIARYTRVAMTTVA